MIICSCNRVSEKEALELLKECEGNLSHFMKRCKLGSSCGQCIPWALVEAKTHRKEETSKELESNPVELIKDAVGQ